MAKLHTFFDNFNDNSFDLSKWTSDTGVFETGEQLMLSVQPMTGCSIYAVDWFDLEESEVRVQLIELPANANVEFIFKVGTVDAALNWIITNSSITAEVFGMGSNSTAYDRAIHKWFRIRESSNRYYLDFSTNGKTWWNMINISSSGHDISNATVGIIASNWESDTKHFFLDNVNYQSISETLTGSATGSGSASLDYETASFTISAEASGGGQTSILTNYQALPQKSYEYRVWEPDGTFLGTWKNVVSDFGYSQTVNQNASELTVDLSRSPFNRQQRYDALLDNTGAQLLDDAGEAIFVQTSESNTVGVGTDVENNYNVDVYAFYGGYEALQDHNGQNILDDTGDTILVQFGHPNGIRVYSGYILDYELTYGQESGVSVVIAPHATEMSHYIFMDGSNTTVAYNSVDPVLMAREAMDSYIAQGGVVTYNASSMPLSGEVASYDFKLQTTREAVDRAVDLLPASYYHYVHPGENIQYLFSKSDTADHVFYYQKHISSLRLRRSLSQLINKVYVVGGDVGGTDLFKYYSNATSITNYRPGLERIADSRVTLATTAQILADNKMEEFDEPRYRTEVTINDVVYDIESIRLGDMVGFRNFGSFVDDLLLQIVTIEKRKHSVSLTLDMAVPSDAKRIEDIKRRLLSEDVSDIADIPA